MGTDILHVHDLSSLAYGVAGSAPAGAVRRVCSFHSPVSALSSVQRVLAGRLLKRVDVVHAVSASVGDSLREGGVPEGKLRCIRNGIVLADFPFRTGEDRIAAKERLGLSARPTIGVVARLAEKKRIPFLIDIASAMQSGGTPVTLVVVGSGENEAELGALADRSLLPGSFRLLPPRRDVIDVYAALDVFVIPSVDEGLPQSVLEAMATGTVVVAPRARPFSEILSDGHSGVLLSASSPTDWAVTIRDLLADDGRRADLARNARDAVESSFSFDETSRGYEELYLAGC
jgi:glycosyltransferase involved in cell wall biosynthesis